MTATYQTVLESIPEFSADGKRLRGDDGSPTNAGYREANVLLYIERGATRERAEWMAAQKITTTKRGGIAFVFGGATTLLTKVECLIVGREPGRGNY